MPSRRLPFSTRREPLWRLLPKTSNRMIYHSVFVAKNRRVCDRVIDPKSCEKSTNDQAKSPVGDLCDGHLFIMIKDIGTAPEANPTSPNLAAMWKKATAAYLRHSRLLLLWDGPLHSFLWGDCICNKQRVHGKPNTSNITHKDIACTYDSSVPELLFQYVGSDFPPGHHEHTSSHSSPPPSSANPSPNSLRSQTTACTRFRGYFLCTRPNPRTRKNRRIPANIAHPPPARPPSAYQKRGIPPTWPPFTRT